MFGGDILFTQRLLKSLGYYTGGLDGIFGPKTDKAISIFNDKYDEIADELGRFDKRSETIIMTLHPVAQEKARKFLKKVKEANILGDTTIKIISGTRTYTEQSAIYAQGRTKPGNIVTNAAPGRSNHNFGIAWDVGLFKDGDYLQESSLYRKVGAEGKKIDQVEWGGDWSSFVDTPHYQVINGITLAQTREKFEKGESYL